MQSDTSKNHHTNPPSASFPALPIDTALPSLHTALETHGQVILCAPPGSGKTTRVPLSLLHSPWGSQGMIVVLEPRRVAARKVADFMAHSLGETVGKTVGYQVHLDKQISDATRILVVTEGILTRRFLADPLLDGISCVIIDEFHERSIHVDVALCLLKETMTVRDDLKTVVMSATLNTSEIASYLNNCPVINVEGAPFPLQTVYAENRTDLLTGEKLAAETVRYVQTALQRHGDGDILVFLPGAAEINKTAHMLQTKIAQGIDILPLYGALPAANQDDAVAGGRHRRVVLSTNIAETSLTIPNVSIVIDSGMEKRVEWRSGIGFEKLVTARISRFSAIQRAGRAARTSAGTVYRMWSLAQEKEMQETLAPEILRRDPVSTVFTLIAAFSAPPNQVDMLTPLGDAAIKDALHILRLIGLTAEPGTRLSQTGKWALTFPLHPRLAASVITALQMKQGDEATLAAAILEEAPLLSTHHSQPLSSGSPENCDIAYRIDLLQKFIQHGQTRDAAAVLGLNFNACARVIERQHQLQRIAKRIHVQHVERPYNYLLGGFPDRVCLKASPEEEKGVMATGRGVWLGPQTRVRTSPLFLALDASSDSHRSGQRSEVVLASALTREELQQGAFAFFSTVTELEYDSSADKVAAFERTRYMSLILKEKKLPGIPNELQGDILLPRALHEWQDILFATETQKNALSRLAFARHCYPALNTCDISPEGFREQFALHCRHARGLSDLKKINFAAEVISQLPYDQQQKLKTQIPSHISLPSGRHAEVDYTRWYDERTTPIIRVRLQELFGLVQTPRIADARIALSIALLAPNGREVQITTDLESFWKNTYPEVRRELRARYAKHFWPEDPLTAIPTHLTQKQFQKKNPQ